MDKNLSMLEKNYITFKSIFKDKEKTQIELLKNEYSLTDNDINFVSKVYSCKEKIICKTPDKFEGIPNDKEKAHKMGYEEGMYSGASLQAESTVNNILATYMDDHMKRNKIDTINFTSFKSDIDYYNIIKKINYDILLLDYDINYVYYNREYYYYILIQKDNNDNEFKITFITSDKIIKDYEPNYEEQEKIREYGLVL